MPVLHGIYVAGFQIQPTATEIRVYVHNNHPLPSSEIILPYSTAKSLVKALEESISDFEAVVGSEVQELQEIGPKLAEALAKKNNAKN